MPRFLADPAARDRVAAPEDDIFEGMISFGGRVLVGMPWGIKRGGETHNILIDGSRQTLQQQVRSSFCTWWAPECKSFSRARGRPVPGATH